MLFDPETALFGGESLLWEASKAARPSAGGFEDLIRPPTEGFEDLLLFYLFFIPIRWAT